MRRAWFDSNSKANSAWICASCLLVSSGANASRPSAA